MEETARILAVDDSITIRKALEMILVPAGYQVELAASGTEAIAKTKEFNPDVILLDFILPDMRGIDVCTELVADEATRNIPVVLISARGTEIRQAYLAADNVVEYLVKPFTPDEVLSVIQAVLLSDAEEEAAAEEVEVLAESGESQPMEPSADGFEEVEEEAEFEAPVGEVVEPEELAASAEDVGEVVEAGEELEWQPAEVEAPLAVASADQRESLAGVFETLRAGLEGIFVEESELASAGDAGSYTDLAALLSRQMPETLGHAISGKRFALASDGSVRSLEDALLDSHRRICRLLFRAVRAGVVETNAAPASLPRILAVSGGRGAPGAGFARLADHTGCEVFHITSDLDQIPLMTRCYGPTHLVVDLSLKGAWAELATLHRLGDTRRLKIIGIYDGDLADLPGPVAQVGIGKVISSKIDLAERIRECIFDSDKAPASTVVLPGAPGGGAGEAGAVV